MEAFFPYKAVTRHSTDKPWVTDSFRQLVRKRQQAYMSGNTLLLRMYRKKVNREASRLRRRFFQTKVDGLAGSGSKDW